MAIVPATDALREEDSAITLPRYAHLIRYSECSFFGVVNPDDQYPACRTIWSKIERDNVLKYLAESQVEIENQVGYFLHPRWVVGSKDDAADDRLVDQQDYLYPVMARWRHVIEAGVRAEDDIEAGSAVDHTADPAVVGPIATTVTDEEEIRVYHPGTDVEIHPSAITIAAGNVTIEIPRCRMVTEAAYADSDNAEGVPYDDTTQFEATVDVKRIYNDPSTHAVLIWPHLCAGGTGSDCCSTCGDYTQTACIYINDYVMGVFDVQPATYSGGAWSRQLATCCGEPSRVRLNYLAGMRTLDRQAEDAIVRLAHSKMPAAPCGCDIAKRVWERDRAVGDVLTRERINCPFGVNQGAWIAWRFTQSLRTLGCSVL